MGKIRDLKMKISPILIASINAEGVFVQKDEASNVLSREGRANTNLLTEEFRVGNLERECNEEVCSWDEAFEIFENEVKTNDFMNSKEHVCENTTPCYSEGMKSCVNKWGNYWCECQEGWYGKDCDHIDADGTFKCMNENGCRHTFGSAPVQTIQESVPEAEEQTISRGDERQEIAAAPKPVRIPLKPFVEDVWCDTVNNQFIVHLPDSRGGELKMGLDLDHAQCGATDVTEQGLIFSYGFDECGTRMRIEDDHYYVYDNHIGRGPEFVNGVLRDYGVTYNVRCTIDRLGHVDNVVQQQLGPDGSVIFVGPDGKPVNGTGEILPVFTITDPQALSFAIEDTSEFLFRMNVYHTAAYENKFTIPNFPLMRHFKESIYLGVEVITKMEYQYIYTQRCWASPSADPHNLSAEYYNIMQDGCPSDQYTSLRPRHDLEDRFQTQTFKFQDSDFVYIQCDVIVCDMRVPNDPECQTTCRQNDKLRRTPVESTSLERYRRSATEKIREVVTVGPFEIRPNQRSKRETSSYAGWVMAGMSLFGLAGYIGFQKRHKLIKTAVEPEPQ